MESLKYNYRKSALEKEKSYELTKEGVEVTEENKASTIYRYDEISEVNLTYAPTKYATIYQCSVNTNSGKKFTLKSHHYAGLADFQDRSEQYVAFIKAMHKLFAVQATHARYRKGISPLGYYLSMAVFIIAGLVFPLITIVSLFFGNYIYGGIGVVGCIFLFLKMKAYMKKNKPGSYDPSELPSGLLPTVKELDNTVSPSSEMTVAE